MPGQSFRGFAERVALVTGGARGVSRAVALQLAYEGAYVIISHPPEDGESASVTDELRSLGTLANSFAADVSRAPDVQRLFSEIEGLYGRLDLLVNSAGLSSSAPLAELTEELWTETLDANLKSVFLCAQGAARLMRTRPKAAIVNLSAEMNPEGHSAAYAAAQAGIVGLTKALARELAPRIRVNCVSVRSEPPEPDEIARACVYLLSSDATSVTGQTLCVGGQRAV